jgi:excisionase family DNA binding protein
MLCGSPSQEGRIVKNEKREPESPFLTVHEVAAILRVHKNTMVRHLERGLLPGIAFGTGTRKIWRCRRDEIMALGVPPKE